MEILKTLPQINQFIQNKAFIGLSKKLILGLSKNIISSTRNNIINKKQTSFNLENLIKKVLIEYDEISKSSLKPIINATGVIIHTNLGRSIIDPNILENIKDIISNYNNLEYDLDSGARGERYTHITKLLQQLTGCEDALIVNNNASAIFLILNTFAKGKKVIVSRGELVEIGGSFRIPEVMKQSGAILKEIGTTNKTNTNDYTNAITKHTSVIMKVHKSNYSIEGFSSDVCIEDITKIAQKNNLIDYYDMGSGHMVDLPYGLDSNEPSIVQIMKHNPSLVSFSGDKLLGSVQAGIIIGKNNLINKLKKNQLLRMLRVDKITLCILEENLKSFLFEDIQKIPTLRMLFDSIDTLKNRAKKLEQKVPQKISTLIKESKTIIGGGTTPNKKIPTITMSISFNNLKPSQIEKKLRNKNLIGRIENNMFVLDFRTIQDSDISKIIYILQELVNE